MQIDQSPTSFAGSRKFADDEKRRIVYYERGVGTGALVDQFMGGAFGSGLSDNVRRAYRFLSWYYEPDDEVFIFGFSRGAYTARSLVGLIGCAGLLKRESCDAANEAAVWSFYRTSVNDRVPAPFDSLTKFVHDRNKFRIKCLGVFETVGALGVPLPVLRRKNREIYGFHDVEIGSIVECNLHAVAIDEHREPFEATLWRRPKFKAFSPEMSVEQVWFAGAHSDIGGGYIPESDRALDGGALDDITLDWMLKRVLIRFPNFPVKMDTWGQIDERACTSAPQHEPRKFPYTARPFVYRTVCNQSSGARFCGRNFPYLMENRVVGYDRHAEPIGQKIHISALERIGKKVRRGSWAPVYRPRNLEDALPLVKETYSKAPNDVPRPLFVVDWDGQQISTIDPKVLALMARPELSRAVSEAAKRR